LNQEEYRVMREVEDRHWWYRGLRGMFDDFWRDWASQDAVRVIDVGCGTGAVLSTLPEARPFGIDLAPEAVALCVARGLTRCAVASAVALPFGSATFDAGLAFDVLPHRSIRDKHALLREVHRVLKPGGVVFVNVPAYQWLWSSHDAAVHQDRRFTKGELLGMLEACSLEPLRAAYWNASLFVPMALVRLWRKTRPPAGSDLSAMSGRRFSGLLNAVLTAERRCGRLVPFPFGLSIFAAARKAL
jgi:SAM-dependent methyltransferase